MWIPRMPPCHRAAAVRRLPDSASMPDSASLRETACGWSVSAAYADAGDMRTKRAFGLHNHRGWYDLEHSAWWKFSA